MNAGPYSEEKVQKYIEENFIPLKSQCSFTRPTELMQRFIVTWTPTLVVHDAEGREHHKFVGFVPTDDFLAQLGLGKGKVLYNTGRFAEAVAQFRKVFEEYPASGAAPEAIFFLGVAGYRDAHDPKALRRAYDMLVSKYPQSEWARRAEPYSAIEL